MQKSWPLCQVYVAWLSRDVSHAQRLASLMPWPLFSPSVTRHTSLYRSYFSFFTRSFISSVRILVMSEQRLYEYWNPPSLWSMTSFITFSTTLGLNFSLGSILYVGSFGGKWPTLLLLLSLWSLPVLLEEKRLTNYLANLLLAMIPNIDGACWSVLLSLEGILPLLAMEVCDAPIFRL